MATGEKSYTAGGKMRAPEKLLCLQWGRKLGTHSIQKWSSTTSKVCGISIETNGSEDSLIHHIKPGVVAADAAAEISTEIATFLQDDNEDDLDTDPFASDETVDDKK